MTLEELTENIRVNNIPERWYSIDDGLKDEALVLYKNYSVWEFFYFEKGNRNDFRVFNNESDAFDFLWSKLIEIKQL